MTPKTESRARDELIEWNRRMLHAQEPDFTDLIDRACSEAASKAVAEVRGPFNSLTADWPPIQRSKALAAFDAAALIASERGT